MKRRLLSHISEDAANAMATYIVRKLNILEDIPEHKGV